MKEQKEPTKKDIVNMIKKRASRGMNKNIKENFGATSSINPLYPTISFIFLILVLIIVIKIPIKKFSLAANILLGIFLLPVWIVIKVIECSKKKTCFKF